MTELNPYDEGLKNKGNLQKIKRLAQIVVKNINFLSGPIRDILDVGCATGEMSNILSFYLPFIKIYGCDFSEAIIKKAKGKYPHLKEKFFVADIYNLSQTGKKFDLVICSNLGHFEHPERVLEQLIDVSKRFVIVLTPAEQEPARENKFLPLNENFFTSKNFLVHKDFTSHPHIDGIQFVCILDKKARPKKMTTYRILIAAPIRQEPEILAEFLNSLSELDTKGLEIAYLFIDNNDNKTAKKILQEFANAYPATTIWESPPLGKQEKQEYHEWPEDMIQRVAGFKNAIIEYALKQDYNYLFLIDSDLVIHPFTLKHLLNKNRDIISTIFWTKWKRQICALPQVWFGGHYEMFKKYRGEKLNKETKVKRSEQTLMVLIKPGTYEVGGLGACTLISRKALKKGVSFKEIYNLPYMGEDRHFCLRAVSLGLQLFVDTAYPAFHIYRKSDLSKVRKYKQLCKESIKKGIFLDSIDIIKLVEEGLNMDPHSYYQQGERLYNEGKTEEAIAAFNKALELDPSFALAHNDLAFIYWQKGNVERALHHITKAMELAPDDRDVIWNCGQIMLGLGYIKDAYEVYNHYLAKHPNETEIKQIMEDLKKKMFG